MVSLLVAFIFFLFTIKALNIDWFKTTPIHQNNIVNISKGWSECPYWHSLATSTNISLYNLTALCITLQVPLNWDDDTTDNNNTIDYMIARIFSGFDPNNVKGNGAFWMLAGGPSQPGQALYPITIPFLNFLDASHDIYIPDHRGTGYSNILECNKSLKAMTDNIYAVKQCINYLNKTYGDDLHHFSTYAASMDLGYAVDLFQSNLSVYNSTNHIVYGWSYGTYYLNQYLLLFPHQFNASIFDGILPPDIGTMSTYNNHSNMAGLAFLHKCDENIFCSKMFKGINTTILNATKRIFDQLIKVITDNNTNECVEGIQTYFNGTGANKLRKILWILLVDRNSRVIIPPIIYRMYRCNEKDQEMIPNLMVLLSSLVDSAVNASDRGMAEGLYLNIIVSEIWDGLNASVEALLAAEDKYYFSYGSFSRLSEVWDIWNRYEPNPTVYNQYANPTIPMLLMNGDLDPQTHIKVGLHAAGQYAASINNELSQNNNRYFFTFPNTPHFVLATSVINNYTGTTLTLDDDLETCGMYVVKSFIDPNNDYVPNNDCIGWMSDIDWNATSNISKQFGLRLFGTTDVWGVQSVEDDQTYSPTESPSVGGITSESERIWFIVGLVFICLFGIALITICYLIYLFKSHMNEVDDLGAYEKAKNTDVEVGALKTAVAEDSD